MSSDHESKQLSRRDFLKAAAAGAGFTAMSGVLAACGAQPPAPAAPAQESEPAQEEAAAPEQPTEAPAAETVVLTFWKSPHSVSEQERMGAVIADFAKVQPNIKIEHTITTWETWDETYTAAFAGGNPPDVSYMPDQFYFKFAEAGQLADLGPYVDDPSYASERAAWFKGPWDLGNWRGTQVGIPNIATMFFIYANKSIFEEAGLDVAKPPASYDELVEQAKAMTKPDGEQWGYAAMTTTVDQGFFAGFQYFHDCGANFLNETFDGPGFDNECGVEALTFLSSLMCEHHVQPPHAAFNRSGIIDLFRGGKVGMLMEEVSQHGDFKEQNLGFDYDIFLQPPGRTGQSSFGNFGFFMIAEATENKDAAWEFIKYITSGPVLGAWAEQHGFAMMRGDVELYKDDPIYAKAQKEIAPKILGFQAHAKLREVLNAMWSEFEGSFACQRAPEESIAAAAEAVSNVLA
jgi:ABC-type glycerol-3-phosphate transport system substrate-binding protein